MLLTIGAFLLYRSIRRRDSSDPDPNTNFDPQKHEYQRKQAEPVQLDARQLPYQLDAQQDGRQIWELHG
jgi:hypothetical protein